MFIDTALEAVMATSAVLPLPTPGHKHHATSSVSPIPTVYPGPSYKIEARTDLGDRTLWAVFVIMFISSLVFYVLAWRQPASKRLFHVLTAFITTFATISYYAMAVGDGISMLSQTTVQEGKHGLPDTTTIVSREIYWARYVDWSVTTPLLLLDLAILAGLNGADITVAIVADILMVVLGLFGSLSEDKRVAYAYWAMGCVAYLVIVYLLAVNGRAVVKTKDSKTATFFTSISVYTLLLWTAYPVIWVLAEGSGIVSVNQEIMAYAVLDVLAKAVFGAWLLFTHDSMASSSATVGGFWSHGIVSEGGIRVGDSDDA